MRIYDGRLGRFLSVDPLAEDYPYYTPYQFAGNSPIELIDIDGAEGGKLIDKIKEISDAVTNFFTFESEKEEIKEGTTNTSEGINKQLIGPWDWRIFNSENPGLDFELRRIDGQIQSTLGVVQISSGVQGASAKAQLITEVPLILKDLSTTAIKKTSNNAINDIKPGASPKAKKTVAKKITGYTNHGLNQAIGRDGGKGVKPSAILDAVNNPKKVVPGSSVGSTIYKGKKATVVLNDDGKIITTAGSSSGPSQRIYNSKERKSGSGSAQRKANSQGVNYNPNAIH